MGSYGAVLKPFGQAVFGTKSVFVVCTQARVSIPLRRPGVALKAQFRER